MEIENKKERTHGILIALGFRQLLSKAFWDLHSGLQEVGAYAPQPLLDMAVNPFVDTMPGTMLILKVELEQESSLQPLGAWMLCGNLQPKLCA